MNFDPTTGKPVPRPATPNRMPNWPWKMILLCAGVFLLGIILGAAAGNSGKPAAASVTSIPATTVTVAGPTTTLPASTVTVTTTKSTPPQPKPKPAKTFTGSGIEKLVIYVGHSGYLTWTNDGLLFQIFTSSADVWANSQAHSGRSYVHSGRYEITVNAIGNWKLVIP